MIGKFFHTPSPKKFYITPRFYDPDKEERENREKRIREELGLENEKRTEGQPFRPNIKGQFRNSNNWKGDTREAIKSQRRRLTYLIIILMVIFLLVYYSDRIF